MTQKIPEQLELRDDWPRAGTGKIVKKALREEYAGTAARPPRALPGPAGRPAGAAPYRVCFVCTGNICRSPMADVVLRQLAGQTPGCRDRSTLPSTCSMSSAGTGPWHEGEPMDPRARDRPRTAPATSTTRHVARHVNSGRLGRPRPGGGSRPPPPRDAARPGRRYRPSAWSLLRELRPGGRRRRGRARPVLRRRRPTSPAAWP